MIAGCSQVIVEKRDPNNGELVTRVQVNLFLKDVDFNDLHYKGIFDIEGYESDTQEVKAITPYGTIETVDGE